MCVFVHLIASVRVCLDAFVCMYVCVRAGVNGVSVLIWIATDHIEHASFIDVAFNTNHVGLRW